MALKKQPTLSIPPPLVTPGVQRVLRESFLAYLILAVACSCFHYLCYVPPFNHKLSKLLGSTSWGNHSTNYMLALDISRDTANFNELFLLVILATCIVLTIMKRKNARYLLATLATLVIVAWLDDAAYYLPN